MVVPTRAKINFGFALALTFLAVISVFTCRESLRSMRAVRWVKRPGKHCGYCDFLSVCLGDKQRAQDTLVRMT